MADPVLLAPMSGVSDRPFRRLVKRHSGLPGSAEFRAAINRCDELERVKAMIRTFYDPLFERQVA